MLSGVTLFDGVAIALVPSLVNFSALYWLHSSVKQLDRKIKEVNVNSDRLDLYNRLQSNLEFNVIGFSLNFGFISSTNDKDIS